MNTESTLCFCMICTEPPKIVQISETANLTIDSDASISCIGENDRPEIGVSVTIVWYQGSVERARSTTGALTLGFSPVFRNDSGVYTCLAMNVFGSLSRSLTLTIQGKGIQIFEISCCRKLCDDSPSPIVDPNSTILVLRVCVVSAGCLFDCSFLFRYFSH